MLKRYFIILCLFIASLAMGTRGEAFVPQTPHLLYLTVNKIRVPTGMEVFQTRQIFGASQGEAPGDPLVSFEERLRYRFPLAVRADIQSGSQGFDLFAREGFVRIKEGVITEVTPPAGAYYAEPLVFRDYEIMTQVLAQAGINTAKVTFQRLEGAICYLIGEPPYGGSSEPGLWIEKGTFFPMRYLIRKKGRMVDIRYNDWQRVSRTWYPGLTRIYVDGHLFSDISVTRIRLTPELDRNLFDLESILTRYPRMEDVLRESTDHDGRIENLDKEIEAFKSLYD